MAKYRKKPVVIEATQWFQNGDHPKDHDPIGYENPTEQDMSRYHDYLSTEGKVVRYYRVPELDGLDSCDVCGKIMHNHGWVDTLEGGHIVCQGDWIITGVKGEYYPIKPDIFEMTYEPLTPPVKENKNMKIETFRMEQRRCCYNCFHCIKTTKCTLDTDLDLDHPECATCNDHWCKKERVKQGIDYEQIHSD